MYVRGREMRRRYIEGKSFISPAVDNEEIYAYVIDRGSVYQSAMAYFTGLYPPGSD
jgi:hypothetical protein